MAVASCTFGSSHHADASLTNGVGSNCALAMNHIGFKRLWERASVGAPKWANKTLLTWLAT